MLVPVCGIMYVEHGFEYIWNPIGKNKENLGERMDGTLKKEYKDCEVDLTELGWKICHERL